MIRAIRVLMLFAVIPAAHAERKYLLSFSSDVLTGGTNQIGTSSYFLGSVSKGLSPFYGAYPTVNLKSVGRRSTLDVTYTFTFDRYEMETVATTLGHNFRSEFNSQLSRTLRFRMNGTFTTTPQVSTVNVLTGISLNPLGDFNYIFEPQLLDNIYKHATAGIGLDLDLGKTSFLSFSASGGLTRYDADARASFGLLSNQTRLEGSLSYNYRKSQHQTWGIKYTAYENFFRAYGNVRSHSASITYSRELSPSLHVNLAAGPSFTEKTRTQPEYFGYTASIDISKTIRTNLISLRYNHRSGDSTGYGGATDSHQAGIGFSRAIGKRVTLRVDAFASEQKQRVSSAFKQRSISGSAALSRAVGKHWQVSLGASYQDYPSESSVIFPYPSYPGRVNRRVYLSIGYRMPEMWRVAK